MKDITPTELPDKRTITFTRPQHEDPLLGGLGQIGVVILDTKDDLKNPDILQNAPIIETRFLEKEWGGIKYAVALKNNKVGVLLHIARFDDDPEFADYDHKPKIYSTCAAVYDIGTRRLEDVRIVAMADEFHNEDGTEITPKTKLLKKVAFGTAVTQPNSDGFVMVIVGVGDAVTCYKKMKDPWAGQRLTDAELSLAP